MNIFQKQIILYPLFPIKTVIELHKSSFDDAQSPHFTTIRCRKNIFFCTKNHVVQVQLNKTQKNIKKIIYYKLGNIWSKNTIWIQDLPWAYNQLITVQKKYIIRGYHWIVWCINHAGLSNQEGHIWRDLSLTGPICVCCLWSWKQNNISGPNITLSLFPSRVAVGLHL